MKKYKRIIELRRLQQKLDNRFGKGFYKASCILLLFGCLFFTTSCKSESSEGQYNSSSPVGSAERSSSQTQTQTNNQQASIRITNTGQTVTLNKNPFDGSDYPQVLDAFFAKENKDTQKYERILSAGLQDMVYVVVDTLNIPGRTVTLTIRDENKIIDGDIPFLQYKEASDGVFSNNPEDVKGIFTTKVRNQINDQRFAIYKLVLKAEKDETTNQWIENIQKHNDKKLKLYLTVEVKGEEDIVYCGSNYEIEEERRTDAQNNVWLNQDKKWFEVENPVITYHIYWNNETEGKIEKHIPPKITKEYENKYKYIYYDKEGKDHNLGIYSSIKIKNNYIRPDNRYGKDTVIYLINLNDVLQNYNKNGKKYRFNVDTDRPYVNRDTLASFFGALFEVQYEDISCNGFSHSDGSSSPSVSHLNGYHGDFKYLREDKALLKGAGTSLNIRYNPELLDIERQNEWIDALYKFGWTSFLGWSYTINKKKYFLNRIDKDTANHDHHLHIQYYNMDLVKEIK